MRQRLEVFTDANGTPQAQVPFSSMWDLVEYLSCQRTMVHYSYQSTCFTVQFLRMDQAAAQAMLDDWAAMESVRAEPSHASR